jgi:GxxExxY protein
MTRRPKCKNCREEGHYSTRCPQSIVTTVTIEPESPPDEQIEEEVISGLVAIPIGADTINKFKTLIEMFTTVSTTLCKGFNECVYELAVCAELQDRHIRHSAQETIPIMYKGHYVGNNRLDIILLDWLPCIIELKASSGSIKTEERWQVIRYMERKCVPYGVVVNFTQSVKGRLYISFIVKHEDHYYQYDLETGMGKKMVDFF